MANTVNHQQHPLPVQLKRGGLTNNPYLTPILSKIFQALRINFSVEGLDVVGQPGGLHMRGKPVIAGNPFSGRLTSDGSGLQLVIAPGTFHGIVPTISGTPLTDGPTLSVSSSGHQDIYLRVDSTLSTANGFVYAFDFDSCLIAAASTMPDDDRATAQHHILLGTVDDGAISGWFVETSLDGFIEDDGSLTDKGQLFWFRA